MQSVTNPDNNLNVQLLEKLSEVTRRSFSENRIWTMVQPVFGETLLSYPVDTELNQSWKLSVFDIDTNDREKSLKDKDVLPRQIVRAAEDHEESLAETLWNLLSKNVTKTVNFSDLKESIPEDTFFWMNIHMEDQILIKGDEVYQRLDQEWLVSCFNSLQAEENTTPKGFLIPKGAIEFYSNTITNVQISDGAAYIGVFGENGPVFRLSQEMDPSESLTDSRTYRYYIDLAYGLDIDYSKIVSVEYNA